MTTAYSTNNNNGVTMYLLNLYKENILINQHVITYDECMSLISGIPSDISYVIEPIKKGLTVDDNNVIVANIGGK
jgi:hypothetical protein